MRRSGPRIRRRLRSLTRTALLTVVVGTLVLPGVSPAATPSCQPPRCVAETLVFQGVSFGFNVLLPPDYDTSGRPYPVLYLMHGGFQNQNDWIENSDIVSFTAGLPDSQQAIVVMPFSPPFGWTVDWGDFATETFDTDVLIPYVDATYRTVAKRSHRAIAGISYGGFGALHLATRHPDLFSVMGGFSGVAYAFSDIVGGPLDAAGWWAVNGIFNLNCSLGDPPGLCPGSGDTGGLNAPFGDPITNEIEFHNHSLTDLAVNLRTTNTYIATGTGVPCDVADVQNLVVGAPFAAGEPISLYSALRLELALQDAGAPSTAVFKPCGIHDIVTYRYWNQDLRDYWRRTFTPGGWIGSADPASFDFRSADAEISVWDWTFSADPRRAKEFLDIRGASASGVTLTGSGRETVTTAPYFAPFSTVQLTNAQESSVTADSAGRITFHVNLGPPHSLQQYTVLQRVAEMSSLGNYWITRSVRFIP